MRVCREGTGEDREGEVRSTVHGGGGRCLYKRASYMSEFRGGTFDCMQKRGLIDWATNDPPLTCTHARTHARTHAHAHPHTHALTRNHTRTHTQTHAHECVRFALTLGSH